MLLGVRGCSLLGGCCSLTAEQSEASAVFNVITARAGLWRDGSASEALPVLRRITAAELHLSLPHGKLLGRAIKTWCDLLQAATQGQVLSEAKGSRWGASYPMQLRILFTR